MKRIVRAAAVVLLAVALLAGGQPSFSWGATPTSHTIAVFGDPHEADPTAPDLSAGFQLIVPFLAQTGADAAIGLGDYSRVDGLTRALVDDRYTTFLSKYDQTGIPRSDTVWVQGNHDAESDMVRTEWARLFGEPANLHTWGLHQIDGLYVIQLENWAPGYDNGHIGYYGEGDPLDSSQANWLVSTLQSLAPEAGIVVAMHAPIAESAYANNGESARLEALFAKYGVDLVLGGHVHDYRRHMDPTGIPYITEGMAGAPPVPIGATPVDHCDTVEFSGTDYSPQAFGYLTIEFDGATMHVTAYAVQLGSTTMRPFDSFGVRVSGVATTAPVNTSPPVVSGTAGVNGTLSCTTGAWRGDPAPTYAYQWLRDGTTKIAGATKSTHVVTSADQGHGLSCVVTASNVAGQASANSNTVQVAAAPGAPVDTALPVISGTPALGQTLSCSTGSWTGSPTSFGYQWLRDGVAISGVTQSTYVVATADQGHSLSCVVMASNSAGSTSATSATVSVPAAANPSISLRATPHRLKVRKSITLSGVVRHFLPGDRAVRIYRKAQGRLTLLKKLQIDGSGAFRWVKKAKKDGRWVFLATYRAGGVSYASNGVTVRVHK